MKNKNWVDEVLEDASNTVKDWPSWMRRPEIRAPESLLTRSSEDMGQSEENDNEEKYTTNSGESSPFQHC